MNSPSFAPGTLAPASAPREVARLVTAERRKLLSTRAWLWALLASTAWAAVSSILALVLMGHQGGLTPPLSTSVGQRTLLAVGAGGAGPIAALLGLVAATGEFRHHTASTTFLVTPRRGRVVAAKLITYFLAGVAYALECLAATLAIALPWLTLSRIGVVAHGLDDPGVILSIVVAVPLFAVAGVGLGLLLRHQVATLITLLVYLYVAEPLVSHINALHGLTQYLPGVAADGLTQATQPGVVLLSPWLGGLVFAGYAVALSVAGWGATIHQDIA